MPHAPMPEDRAKRSVAAFWEARPCGSSHTQAGEGSPEYFEQVERRRYELEPFIERYARFEEARGKALLEIGVGLGTDFIHFARAGARVTGVDLSARSIRLVHRRLDLEGLSGEVRVADAEALPFPDQSFDRVYSWGVLHHTPNTAEAINEAIRVLRPGGVVCVMLYGRRSWVAFGLWARHALLKGRPGRSLSQVIAEHMESQGTKAFTVAELKALFAELEGVRIERVATPYDRRVVGRLAGLTGRWLGWFLVIRGAKRSA
jgi:SAM-dependent methyltransferase